MHTRACTSRRGSQGVPETQSQSTSSAAGARSSLIGAFVKLQRFIAGHRNAILASVEHGLAGGRIESINTTTRLSTRIAFGFAIPDILIALAMLSLGGHPPALHGRK